MKTYNLKVFAIFLLLIACSCTSNPVGSDKDIADIRQLITEQFKSAWDDNDATRLASLFEENADLAFPVSGWIRGREAILEAFAREKPEGVTAQFEIKSIRFLQKDMALVNLETLFSRKNSDGQMIPGYRDSATALLKKEGEGWKYLALRVMPARIDAPAIRDSIESAWSHYIASAEAGDAEEAMKIYAPDLIVIGNDLPEQNYQEIRAHYITAFEVSVMEVQENKILEFEVMGNRASHRGIYHEIQHWNSGEVMEYIMNYYAVWERQTDDSWKIKRLMFNIRG